MSSSSTDRFEKTFARKKKENTSAAAAAADTTTTVSTNKKSNSDNIKTTDAKTNIKSLKIHLKSRPPSFSSSSLSKPKPKKQPKTNAAPKPSQSPSKPQQPNKHKPPSSSSTPKKNNPPSDPAKPKKKLESAKKDDDPSKEKKRKVEGDNVGDGKEDVKKSKSGKKEKKGKENNDKDEEEGVEFVFPTARILRIVKSEGLDYRLSGEAVFLINKATEKFIGLFSEDAYCSAVEDRKSFVGYKHLSLSVNKGKRLDFLSDFVPEKIPAEKALAERKSSETQPA